MGWGEAGFEAHPKAQTWGMGENNSSTKSRENAVTSQGAHSLAAMETWPHHLHDLFPKHQETNMLVTY